MSSLSDFQYFITNLTYAYTLISAMTRETYNRKVLMDSLEVVIKMNDYTEEQRKLAMALFYEILSTKAGSIFLGCYRNFTLTAVNKAKEFIEEIRSKTSEVDVELRKSIAKFIRSNAGIFLVFDIDYSIDLDEDEDDDNEYDEENDYLLEETLNDELFEYMRNENNYDHSEESRVKVLRNILRRKMESDEFVIGDCFKCDHELIEQYTGIKVRDYEYITLGCDIRIEYDDNMVTVTIFDGLVPYELTHDIDLPALIEELKKEIRKDTSQCLYDTKLFCRDIANHVSSYVS
jgi:hypothetical protein